MVLKTFLRVSKTWDAGYMMYTAGRGVWYLGILD
jgi:hypothetical protein